VVLFVFNLVVLSPALLRSWPADTDPYFLAAHIRAGTVPSGYPFGFFFLMGLVPWSDWLMRVYPVIMAFCAALCVGFIADLLVGKHAIGKSEPITPPSGGIKERFDVFFSRCLWEEPGWIAAFLVYGFPVFGFRFGIFEEDLLGMVVCLAGLYFALKYFRDGHTDELVLSSMLFLIGLMVWRGSILFLLCAGLLGVLRKDRHLLLGFVALSLLGVWLFGFGLSSLPVPGFTVGDNMPGIYMLLPTLCVGLLGLWMLKEAALELRLWTVFFLLPGLYLAKFLTFSVFPLAVLMVLFFRAASPKRRLFLLEVLMISGSLVAMSSLWNAVPDQHLMDSMQSVASITGGEPIANEWRFGHWLSWFGANPQFSPLSNWDDINNSNASWVLGNCTKYGSLRFVENYSSFCLMAR